MIALENEMIEALGTSAEVEGHDCGSGEMNIFIHTDEPNKTFNQIRPVVAQKELLQNLVAAYREFSDGKFTVLWPATFDKKFKIT